MLLRTTLALAAALLASSALPAAEPDGEPPLEVTLEIDGQRIDAAVGEETVANIAGARRTVKLTAKPTRRFAKSGIEFRYPSHFTYELDAETPGVRIYTVEGPAAMVMLQSYSGEVGNAGAAMQGVLEHLRGAYGDSLVSETDMSIRLGRQTVRGKRVKANLAGQQLQQDVFAIDRSRAVLMVQSILDESGAEPAETAAVRKLLAETFKAGPPADQ